MIHTNFFNYFMCNNNQNEWLHPRTSELTERDSIRRKDVTIIHYSQRGKKE